ncbi:trans-sialidase [Trypanosoma rangeli]|uniref:Trans-sialidase n=1 Tax=Trypanosoma rangeli TaxID=5698 RepID=A0A3R7M4Y2_TRYRA|nr:trans-sialidase [Trypanosoma rangeli]RNE96223.1 trans-sialidase [Trypanosoma rangeli]|eukprot:RNE96223.1 trans-sialidase [Trypanosoma rangeli]
MSRHRFFSAALLLLFALICSNSWAVLAEANVVKPDSGAGGGGGGSPGGTPAASQRPPVTSVTVPSVVEVNGEVVTIAQANHENTKANTKRTLLAKLVESTASSALWALPDSGENSVMQDAIKTSGGVVKTSGGVVKMPEDVAEADFYNPTPVVNGSKIYLLFQSEGASAGDDENAIQMYTRLLVGEIEKKDQEKKTITWKAPTFTSGHSPTLEEKSFQFFSVGGGAGIVTKNGTVVFPAKAVTKGNKEVSLIMYSSDPEKDWRLSQGMTAGDCVDPAVVEWGSGRLLMMTACGEGHRKVYESSNMGKTWAEALGTLSRVWGNTLERDGSGGQSGFITATIEERDVMLVTLPVTLKDNVTDQLHLWLTDAAHIVDVGPISNASKQAAGSALLFRGKEELISLQELSSREGDDVGMSEGLYLANLKEQLEQIKKVVKTWKEVDARVKQLCLPTEADAAASPGAGCSNPAPTEGLVGYLAGSFAEGQWKDEYLGVDATVTSGELASPEGTGNGGVRFKGRGSWAEWPVSKQGQNQRYHFANYNFTLMATVMIHAVPEAASSPIPLLGVRMNDSTVLLGLSYTKERQWSVLCRDGERCDRTSTWELNKKYHVKIVREGDSQGSVYVDGQRVGSSQAALQCKTEPCTISHFYIGGDGGVTEETASNEGRVTVTNVLLYNRPLGGTEISALHKRKVSIPAQEDAKPQGGGSVRVQETSSNHASDTSPQTVPGSALSPTPHKAVATELRPLEREIETKIVAQLEDKHADGCGGAKQVLLPLLLLGVWAFAAL